VKAALSSQRSVEAGYPIALANIPHTKRPQGVGHRIFFDLEVLARERT
jgi:hypothetical protein